MFSMNLVTIDSYQSSPLPEIDVAFSEFRGSDIRHVPVIRIFGSTLTGKKTCLHVHGVFPYIYVPCTVDEDVDSYMYRLASALDNAINVSFGSAVSSNQHVYKIHKVSGIPLYGYHEKEHLFFKIYFYNPAIIKRASDLLQNGSILNQSLQPHEAHIPFILQFMIDYNLYGMSLINLSTVKHRQRTQTTSNNGSQNDQSLELSNSQKYLPIFVARQSLCELEIDAHASDILNRQEIASGLDLNPGIAAIWNDEKARRDAKGLQQAEPQLLYSKNRDSMTYFQTDNDIYQEERLARRLELISQIDESSLSPSTTSYPLEVEKESDSLSASHVASHLCSSMLQNAIQQSILSSGNIEEMEQPKIIEKFQTHEKSMNISLLDADDMNLVEILADLAEESNVEKIIDNDSVLGSQYSALGDQIKDEDKEEEEVEDLNLTSLELESVVSWDETAKPCSQSNISESDINNEILKNHAESSVEDYDINELPLKLPQCDGASDALVSLCEEVLTVNSFDLLNNLLTSNLYRDKRIKIIAEKSTAEVMNFIGSLYQFVFKYYLNPIKIDIFLPIRTKRRRKCKSKRKKAVQCLQRNKLSSQLHYNRNIFCIQEVDHKDLDVYDIDMLMAESSTSSDSNFEDIPHSKTDSWHKTDRALTYTNIQIPAFDGSALNTSSESEEDPDITINRTERRICVYKSGTKPRKQDEIVEIAPKKRLRDSEEPHFQSPNKRRNVDSGENEAEPSTSKTKRNTPIKTRIPRSPRILSGTYSPLDITITSPTRSKSAINNQPELNNILTCTTPKRRSDHLRIALLRDQSRRLSPNNTTAIKVQASACKEFCHSGNDVNGVDIGGMLTDLNRKIYCVENTGSECKGPKTKSRKEVRKKLSFVAVGEEDLNIMPSPIDKRTSENLDLAKCINDSAEHNPLNISINDSVMKTDYNDVYNKGTEADECIAESSKDNKSLSLENSLNQTVTANTERNVGSETEEDVCNMTFTQFINEKIKTNSQHSIVSVESFGREQSHNKLVTIATRFNPPTKQRIVDSMQTYGISAHKFIGPFFSNKADLAKQKESSNKNSNIYDVPPFKSILDKVTGIKLWRRVKVNEFHPSGSSIKSCNIKRALAGYNWLTIQPLVQPPSPNDVKNWLRAKKYLLKKDLKAKKLEADNHNATEVKANEIKGLSNQTAINETTSNVNKPVNEVQLKKNAQESNESSHSISSNDSTTSSLRKALENSLLYKNNETQQHLGISYGQIECVTGEQHVNAADENYQNARAEAVYQYLTVLSLEVHVVTREDLLPDPDKDSIEGIFYAIHNDVPMAANAEQLEHGAIIISPGGQNSRINNIESNSAICRIKYASNETELLNNLITLIRHHDPDILLGWEIETLSWGYVFQRSPHLGFKNFTWQISRVPSAAPASAVQSLDKDNFDAPKVPGRITLDVWRIMRHETALLNYTFENIMYHVMHERISCPNFKTLTCWWKHNMSVRLRVITHYVIRVLGTVRILLQLDIIGSVLSCIKKHIFGRSCEHARLIGIQFYEVFSRGSQFRVESMMLRLAKPLNYIPVSPSVQQRAKMRAPESLPLIMEPQSVFYSDPLIVLDFQSLYPSIIIAYNYCFSTCVGRIEHIGQYHPFEFGATTLRVKKRTALKLRDKLNYAPCGVAYVKSHVRQGILPRMLTEILNTRLMVKESTKLHGSENALLQRVLDSQQLGLKLIANVTYGYTAANFSGRMPCIEVGDSVVSKGRETLERAIKIVESTTRWGGEVVYGDTDSLFVLLPGKSREEAFAIGAEIADTVTAANPPPVKLKFEKVLHPCILQTKKRYCGYMYEYPGQEKPEYLAKGIETVRRDGCPAVAKILEKSLKILFDTKDLSLVKQYVIRQFDKVLRGKISIQDLTFAREFRGLRGYKPTACVPALELTRRLMKKDPRAVPRTGERVRYVVVAGAPNQPLIHCIRSPMEVIIDEGLIPNYVYYITKVIIPPLNRCLNLIGTDVNNWYRDMSRRQTPDKVISLLSENQKSTIRQFFSTVICAACGEQTKKEVCASCLSRFSDTVVVLHEKIRWLERAYQELASMCQSCTGYWDNPECESLDCPILYRLAQARRDLVQIPYLNNILHSSSTNNMI